MRWHVTAVLFDMGLTISHQQPTREDVILQFLREHGHVHALRDVRVALFATDTWWHAWAATTPLSQRTAETQQAVRLMYRDTLVANLGLASNDGLAREFADVFRTSIVRRHNAIFPDVLPTLRALRGHGLRLGVVSNWDLTLEQHCNELGLAPYLDTIVGSVSVGYEKPDPRIFEIALARLAVRADQAMHIGDMYPSDVVGARRAGILPVLLDRHDLQPRADCLRVRSLQELVPLILDG